MNTYVDIYVYVYVQLSDLFCTLRAHGAADVKEALGLHE